MKYISLKLNLENPYHKAVWDKVNQEVKSTKAHFPSVAGFVMDAILKYDSGRILGVSGLEEMLERDYGLRKIKHVEALDVEDTMFDDLSMDQF